MKNKYGNKILKLSINGGFSCPNRENGLNGCLFCSEDGSGKFAGSSNLSITEQINEQIKFLKSKSKSELYIAYFQSFTNTYDKVENLRKKYFEALSHEKIIGLAVATRPDCIDDDTISLFKEINKSKELWIELGFQTSSEKTASIIRRGYTNKVFENTLKRLNNAGIKTVTHLIFGLPYETEEDWLRSINYIADKNLWGIKFHSLYIQKNSDLYEFYLKKKFKVIEKEEYISIITKAIGLIPKEFVVHRITGDADKSELYLPKWSADKLSVIGSIQKRLKEEKVVQGDNYKCI